MGELFSHHQTPISRYHDRTSCTVCGVDLKKGGKKYWHFLGLSNRRHYAELTFAQCCKTCFDMNEHIDEAKEHGRRYTHIECADGHRCVCGSVIHSKLGFCVPCWRAHRMLDKAQAEARLIGKALKELRREIKSINSK